MTHLLRNKLLLFFSLIAINTSAQNYIGLKNSNYAGVYGMYQNPATIVDGRMSFDVNLLGVNFFAGSDYLRLSVINGLVEKRTEDKKFATFNFDLPGPSAFAVLGFNNGLTQKAPFAVGVFSRLRTGITIRNMSRHTMALAYNGLDDTTLHQTTYGDPRFTMDFLSWYEVGATLGFQIQNTDDRVLNGAISIKKLNGIGAFYLENTGVRFRVFNEDSMFLHGLNKAEYGYAASNFFKSNGKFGIDSPFFETLGSGWGVDLGAVFEYRPGIFALKYEDRLSNSGNKYLFKLGVSLRDLGLIHFNKNSKVFRYNGNNLITRKEIDSIQNPETLNNLAQRKFETIDSNDNFYMSLPTALDISFDVNLNNKYYVNFNFIKGFAHSINHGIKQPNYFSITPRIEKKTFELAFPISMLNLERLQVGIMLRTGSFIVGSDALLSILTGSTTTGDFYFMFRIPFYRK